MQLQRSVGWHSFSHVFMHSANFFSSLPFFFLLSMQQKARKVTVSSIITTVCWCSLLNEVWSGLLMEIFFFFSPVGLAFHLCDKRITYTSHTHHCWYPQILSFIYIFFLVSVGPMILRLIYKLRVNRLYSKSAFISYFFFTGSRVADG